SPPINSHYGSYPTYRWRIVMPMRDPEGHARMLGASETWDRIKSNQRRLWEDWISLGQDLLVCRDEAMGVACAVQPLGRAYNEAMSGLLREYRLDDMTPNDRSALFKVMKNLDEVQIWRAIQDELDRLNHPRTVWDKYHKYSSGAHDKRRSHPDPNKDDPADDGRGRALPLTALAKARQ